MSQPHPPFPEPQPHPAAAPSTGSTAASTADPSPAAPPPAPGPRTQSILVPPPQQPAAEPFATTQFAAVQGGPAAAPAVDPHSVTGPVGHDASSPAGAAPGLHTPPPVPGPFTAPVPHPETHAVPAPPPQSADQAGGARHGRSPLAGVRRAAGGRLLVALGLGVLALALLQVGLISDDSNVSLWDAVPTWSTFATLAVLVALVPVAVGFAGRGLPARTAWRVGAGGVAALGAFWVLVGLPLVVSDRGFWLTAALGAAAAAVWLAPGRPE